MNQPFRRETIPPSLLRLLDEDPAPHERVRTPLGAITTRVKGSHVNISVRLRPRWHLWPPSDAQIRAITRFMFRTEEAVMNVLKWAVILAAVYLVIEIGSAFVPGGAFDRVIGGW